MKTTIRNVGNSKGIILPAMILRQLGLDVDDMITLSIENGSIVIKPEKPVRGLMIERLRSIEARATEIMNGIDVCDHETEKTRNEINSLARELSGVIAEAEKLQG